MIVAENAEGMIGHVDGMAGMFTFAVDQTCRGKL